MTSQNKNAPKEPRTPNMDPRTLLPLTKTQESMTIMSSLGFNVLGAELFLQANTNLERAVALGLAFKGTKDYLEVLKPVPTDGSFRAGMRERVSTFAQSLIDKNDGKSHLAARLKRRAGEEISALNGTNTESIGYRNRFNRMMGATAMGMAGVEFLSSSPTTAEAVVGAGMVAFGLTEITQNSGQQAMEDYDSAMNAVQQGSANAQPLPRHTESST